MINNSLIIINKIIIYVLSYNLKFHYIFKDYFNIVFTIWRKTYLFFLNSRILFRWYDFGFNNNMNTNTSIYVCLEIYYKIMDDS